jgi:Saxitoxin biosynthesis operon protein SxtJ
MNTAGSSISPQELRKFGLITGLMLVIFFDGLIPWIWSFTPPLWPLITAGILAVPALIFPKALYPVYKVWMAFAGVLGWINTRIILSLIFYLVFLPVGLVMRLFTDPMHRKLNSSAETYRVESKPPKTENLERPF